MTASRDFVWAMGLFLAGLFAVLFLFGKRIVDGFAEDKPARHVLWVAAGLLVVVGLAMLLRLQNGP